MDSDQLASRVLAGDLGAVARAISLIEDGGPLGRAVAALSFSHTGRATVIGITGPPGAGKSTLVDGLVAAYRKMGRRTAVLAVDPSSPFTGGALLGDRVRMRSHAEDEGVFIRSMATRRHLGGLALATLPAIRICDAAGFDMVIVETVGVGQSEVAVAEAVDCTVVVLVPGMGDMVQTLKAGIMEIGDVFVVNKADHEGVEQTRREIMAMLALADGGPTTPVLLTRADRGEGIASLIEAIDRLVDGWDAAGHLDDTRARNLRREALRLIARDARRRIVEGLAEADITEYSDALRRRSLDPAQVAELVLNQRLPADGSSVARPS